MTLFERWKRSARHRFKVSYKRTLQVEQVRMQKRIDDLKAQHAKQVAEMGANYVRLIEQERLKAEAVAREVMRIRLECGPQKYGTRFTMYATMDEQFVLNSRDLKTHAEYIIKLLSAMIQREFQQIDFSRIKPIDPGPTPSKYPVFRIEPSSTSFDDTRSW